MKVKKKLCIIGILAIMAALAAFFAYFAIKSPFSLTVDGKKISEQEFLAAAALRRYAVTSYFTEKTGGSVDAGFWEREMDGEIPYQKLAEEAIEELKYFHAVYGLAKEKGYIEDDTYEAFLARREAENAYRKEKIAKGEAVYGLSEYSLDLYREYEMDALQKSYCGDLENEGMDITDAQREQYYNENSGAYVQDDDRVLDYVKIPYEEMGMGEADKQEIKDMLVAVYKKMDRENSLADLAGQEEMIAPYFEHAEIAASDVSIYSRSIGDVLGYAWDLKKGESTAVLEEGGCLYLIECTDRKENKATDISEVKDHINKALREAHYDEIIAERARTAAVECDKKQIDAFMRKNVNK